MAWVEPWTLPAMLSGDTAVNVNRVRAINNELFILEVVRSDNFRTVKDE
ncbi:hypothetical protein [Nostoc commune]|nr:hypothetical protein [Nostoc commune]